MLMFPFLIYVIAPPNSKVIYCNCVDSSAVYLHCWPQGTKKLSQSRYGWFLTLLILLSLNYLFAVFLHLNIPGSCLYNQHKQKDGRCIGREYNAKRHICIAKIVGRWRFTGRFCLKLHTECLFRGFHVHFANVAVYRGPPCRRFTVLAIASFNVLSESLPVCDQI
jgi:hypothetical protein